MQRRKTRTKKKQRWGRRLLLAIIVIAALCGLGVVFFPQLNNTWRSANGGNDTPADTAVKTAVVKELNQQKTGNAATDSVIDAAAQAITNTKMATVMAAAKDQTTAAQLLTQAGLNSSEAQLVTNTLFNTSAFDGVRQALAQGNYVDAYQAAKQLRNNENVASLLGQ
ncbi:hypothetical protein ACFQ5J_06155 [Lacticaseibacillus baoqingensis]|uniref:Uncharacterized protein n=1 Tax=Lacticaseibacillus baoqingensis TaxID=2486013 RepID=A0ABW4E4G5_9LACO|nr:hypothetical protein [Lacticaseibacillus baoqingensis]